MSNSTGLVFSFSTSVTYTAPAGDELIFSWVISRDIRPSGVDSSVFGDVTTRYARNVYQIGDDSVVFGDPRVAHLQYIYALDDGESSAYGDPYVAWVTFVYPDGITSAEWGLHQLNKKVVSLGSSSAVFSDPTVYNLRKYVYATPFVSAVIPSPWVGKGNSIEPVGIGRTAVVSVPYIYTLRQIIRTYQNTSDSVVTVPLAYNRNQYIYQATTTDTYTFGVGNVSLEIRHFYFDGFDSSLFGTSEVKLSKRYLTGVGFSDVQEVFGVNRVEYKVRSIFPQGFSALLFSSSLEVRTNTQVLYFSGANASVFGEPRADHNPRPITYQIFDSLAMGEPYVRLHDLYITPSSVLSWTRPEYQYGTPNVSNRNRTMQMYGVDSADLLRSYHYIYNNARPIDLKDRGIDAYGDGIPDVGYHLKTFTASADDSDPERRMGYAKVYNKATILDLGGSGFLPTRFGIPQRVWSNTQYISTYTDNPQTHYGLSWLSFSPIYIQPRKFDTPQMGENYVSFSPKYIILESFGGTRFTKAEVTIHRNIIQPRPMESSAAVSHFSIYNLTPEIHVLGVTYSEYGVPTVKLGRLYVYANGHKDNTIGTQRVEYKTRKIMPGGLNYMFVGLPDVGFDKTQQPPETQFIRRVVVQMGAGAVSNQHWVDPNSPWSGEVIPFGNTDVHTNVLNPYGIYNANFGMSIVKTNIIEIPPGVSMIGWGSPVVLGGTKRIRVSSYTVSTAFGLHDVQGAQWVRLGEIWNGSTYSPYTYHTTSDDNHPYYVFQPQTVGPVFGSHAEVQHYHRTLYTHSNDYVDNNTGAVHIMGSPRVSHNPQYVYPSGFYTYKRGLHEVVRTLSKNFYPYAFDSQTYGATNVILQDYGTKTISVPGQYPRPAQVGFHEVQHRHRTIKISSWNSFSSPKGAQYVGFYTWLYMQGADSSLFGTPWASHSPQVIGPEFVVDDAPFWSGARVRLHHTNIMPYTLLADSRIGRPHLTN